MSKENAYDEHIAPLMTQIAALCQEHKISVFATFILDNDPMSGPLLCTTALTEDQNDARGLVLLMKLRAIVGA